MFERSWREESENDNENIFRYGSFWVIARRNDFWLKFRENRWNSQNEDKPIKWVLVWKVLTRGFRKWQGKRCPVWTVLSFFTLKRFSIDNLPQIVKSENEDIPLKLPLFWKVLARGFLKWLWIHFLRSVDFTTLLF